MGRARVLVVDDDGDVRGLTRIALGFEGFDVVEAADGDAALAAVRADPPDAILLDVMMPGRDGLSVLRELRDDPAFAALPVVVLTAKDLTEDEARVAGPTAFAGKPFTASVLAAMLWRLLGEQGAEPGRAR